jgi:soluble lytic murein transglycosylase-like protein
VAVLAGGAGWVGSADPNPDLEAGQGVLAASGSAPADPGDAAVGGPFLRGAAIVLPQLPAEASVEPVAAPAVIAILELPLPPPPPPVEAPAGSGADAILAAFAGHPGLGWALRVAACESGFNPYAVNRYSGASGLFQFLPSTWRTTPFGNASIWDPTAQAQAARWMYDNGRVGEWVCR